MDRKPQEPSVIFSYNPRISPALWEDVSYTLLSVMCSCMMPLILANETTWLSFVNQAASLGTHTTIHQPVITVFVKAVYKKEWRQLKLI